MDDEEQKMWIDQVIETLKKLKSYSMKLSESASSIVKKSLFIKIFFNSYKKGAKKPSLIEKCVYFY